MTSPVILAMLAMAGAASPQRKAELGVFATVVRPVRISTALTQPGIAAVTIAHSPLVTVLAGSAAAARTGEDIRFAIPVGAQSVTITLTY